MTSDIFYLLELKYGDSVVIDKSKPPEQLTKFQHIYIYIYTWTSDIANNDQERIYNATPIYRYVSHVNKTDKFICQSSERISIYTRKKHKNVIV